jgi:Domain of unknown function (DUF6265)
MKSFQLLQSIRYFASNMMNSNKSLVVICLVGITTLVACGLEEKSELNELKWILGNWQSSNAEGTLHEEWVNQGDSVYLGHAYAISLEGDTTFSENASIFKKDGSIIYSVRVNNDETTDFTLVDIQEQVVFENINHDYPQRIIYFHNHNDSLYARIEGTVDGESQFEDFKYVKVK